MLRLVGLRRAPLRVWAAVLLGVICFGVGAAEEGTHPTPGGTTHEMVLVPAGEFLMGTDLHPAVVSPAHRVYLDTYWIDKYEVTVALFLAFLNAQGSSLAADGTQWIRMEEDPASDPLPYRQEGGRFRLSFPDSADHPVTQVTWFGAQAYCAWAGLRLPTEAEWEKAARGTDGRAYPWGEGIDHHRANYGRDAGSSGADASDGYLTTAPVGSFPAGVSPYGVHDMAGNVWEWVSDWDSSDYYAKSPYRNPAGPPVGSSRVLRGGSWIDWPETLVTWWRASFLPFGPASYRGFRCAADDRTGQTSVETGSWGQSVPPAEPEA